MQYYKSGLEIYMEFAKKLTIQRLSPADELELDGAINKTTTLAASLNALPPFLRWMFFSKKREYSHSVENLNGILDFWGFPKGRSNRIITFKPANS